MNFLRFAVAAALAAAIPTNALAQTLNHAEQQLLVERLEAVLNDNYVFPDRVPTIALELEKLPSAKGIDAKSFAENLSKALVAASDDLHFFVGYDPDAVASLRRAKAEGHASTAEQREMERAANYGFRDARRLDGDIAYIRFDFFAEPQYAQEIAAGAMRFAAGSKALIIDLRYNNGGTLEMAQLLMSYLYPADKEQKFFQYYYNENGSRIERGQWNLAAVPGPRLPDIPVVILTGSTSFSAAEWMAYSLQKLGRATVIGKQTAGGAHPVSRVPIDAGFLLQVPIGQIHGPVDDQDFEGAGVTPDIAVPSSQALLTAQRVLLEKLASQGDKAARWALVPVEFALSGKASDARTQDEAAGRYEGRKLLRTTDGLTYLWRERFTLALEPVGSDLFAVEGTDDYRVRLVRTNGKVSGLERVWSSGAIQTYKRLD